MFSKCFCLLTFPNPDSAIFAARNDLSSFQDIDSINEGGVAIELLKEVTRGGPNSDGSGVEKKKGIRNMKDSTFKKEEKKKVYPSLAQETKPIDLRRARLRTQSVWPRRVFTHWPALQILMVLSADPFSFQHQKEIRE